MKLRFINFLLCLQYALEGRSQFLEGSELFEEMKAESLATLTEVIQDHEEVIYMFNPEKEFHNDDVYRLDEPNPIDYRLGLLMDPCRHLGFDCCINVYGTPEYYKVADDTYPMGPILAGKDEIIANFEFVKETGEPLSFDKSRRADDEISIAEECLDVGDPYPYCQGFRMKNNRHEIYPNCTDNNQTIYANTSCYDVNGAEKVNCVQMAYTQTAFNALCGGSFSSHAHCGTFFEIHMWNGSPYFDEEFIINDLRLEQLSTSGYNTTTLPLYFKNTNESNLQPRKSKKLLCDYKEVVIRIGSLVTINEDAHKCCCPATYDPNTYFGSFFCPQNWMDYMSSDIQYGGPFSTKVDTLKERILQEKREIDSYPYCPYLEKDNVDVMMCSKPTKKQNMMEETLYSSNSKSIDLGKYKSGQRFFTEPCGQVNYSNYTELFEGPDLANGYPEKCRFFECCGSQSNQNHDCDEGDRDFSFIGKIGRVVYVPDDLTKPYLVTFNDGRTNYEFYVHEIELRQPASYYQVWWVQRTRFEFIVRKKKNFKVVAPMCTYDTTNDRYYPYAVVNDDGSILREY